MTEAAPSGGLLVGMYPAASARGFRLGIVPSLCGGSGQLGPGRAAVREIWGCGAQSWTLLTQLQTWYMTSLPPAENRYVQ